MGVNDVAADAIGVGTAGVEVDAQERAAQELAQHIMAEEGNAKVAAKAVA
jgi:hypothetical protein